MYYSLRKTVLNDILCTHPCCMDKRNMIYVRHSGYLNICKGKVCAYPGCTVQCKCYKRKGSIFGGYCRLHGTTSDKSERDRRNLSDELVEQLWNELDVDPNNESRRLVMDRDKNKVSIAWDNRGDRSKDSGWEVDHIYPYSKGGCTNWHNLRIVHHTVNVDKGDNIVYGDTLSYALLTSTC